MGAHEECADCGRVCLADELCFECACCPRCCECDPVDFDNDELGTDTEGDDDAAADILDGDDGEPAGTQPA
jgi:hypothetical protein